MGHKTAFVTAALIIIVINIESKNIVKMFTDNPELIDMASKGLICYTSGMFFLGANFINISYLQSMEKALLSNLISFGRSFLFVVVGILIYPKLFGIYGVWLTLPLADLTVFAMTVGGYFIKRNSGVKVKKYI